MSPSDIARLLPVSRSIAGEPAMILLLSDPTRAGRSDPAELLRLLGLTPAEAKLATLVGQGKSPGEAADQLEITGNTARSTLEAIYSKLEINRQAEHAQIVARLEMA